LPPLAVVDQESTASCNIRFSLRTDHIWRTKFKQALETIVAVDHTPCKDRQIRGCKATTIQLAPSAQVRRDDRPIRSDHPLRAIAGTAGKASTTFKAEVAFLRFCLDFVV